MKKMLDKRKHVLILTLILSMLFGASMLSLNTPEILQTSRNNNIKDEKPKISANHDTIFIDGNADFNQTAVDLNLPGNGTLNKPYIIENYTISASIDGNGIEIRNTDVYFIIRNVTVSDGRSNYNHGFYFNNVTNGELINNTADNIIAGFLLKNSNNNTFTGNLANNSLHGFRIWYSNNNTLTNNTANGNIEYGIFLDNSNNNTLTDNEVTGNLNGFTLNFSNNNTLTNNSANGNIEYGIYLEESNFNEISGNFLGNNGLSGIYEKNCVGNDISDNIGDLQPFTLFSDVVGFDEDGTFILTWTASQYADSYTLYQNGEIIAGGLTITNYTITDLPVETYMFYVKAINEYEERNSNTIEVTVFFSFFIDGNADFNQTSVAQNFNGNGTYGNPYIIENYEIIASAGHGIHIQNTDVYFIIRNVTVSNGRSNNYFGFYLVNVTNAKLENNTANNNLYGFFLKDSYNNTITNNTANNNLKYGIYLEESNFNEISGNILLNNEIGSIYEENCVGNDISDNISVSLPGTLYSNVVGFDEDGTFTLTWTKNADNYTLYQDDIIIAEGLTITNYTITDLPIGTYVFYVKAINEYEERDSNTIKITVFFSLIIDGNADFNQTAVALNLNGNGTYGNPYIIENYEIIASEGHGIHIQNTDVYFIIRDVGVSNGSSNNYFGFYLENVTNGKLENNAANNNLYGFLLKDSYNNTLEGNTATGNLNGFTLTSSNYNTLTYNIVTNNGYGLSLVSSYNNSLTGNIATGNLNGFTLNSSNYNTLTYNIVTNNRHGLSLVSSYNNSLTGNEVSDNTYLGVYLDSSNNNFITENIAMGNLNGFTLSSSNNNTITNNTANNNDQHGFHLWYSNNNILTDNIANNNLKYGIYLQESNFNEISGNSLADNGLGSIYEKMSEEMDFPDIFLISAIIVVIAVVAFIIIKATFFIKKKNKLSGFKLSLKKILRDKNR